MEDTRHVLERIKDYNIDGDIIDFLCGHVTEPLGVYANNGKEFLVFDGIETCIPYLGKDSVLMREFHAYFIPDPVDIVMIMQELLEPYRAIKKGVLSE